MMFEAGNKVWLSTRNIKTTQPSKKLDFKRAGPHTVSKVINKNAYKLGLQKTYQILEIDLIDWENTMKSWQ